MLLYTTWPFTSTSSVLHGKSFLSIILAFQPLFENGSFLIHMTGHNSSEECASCIITGNLWSLIPVGVHQYTPFRFYVYFGDLLILRLCRNFPYRPYIVLNREMRKDRRRLKVFLETCKGLSFIRYFFSCERQYQGLFIIAYTACNIDGQVF